MRRSNSDQQVGEVKHIAAPALASQKMIWRLSSFRVQLQLNVIVRESSRLGAATLINWAQS